MPALFFYGIGDLQRKFLNSFRKNMLPMASFMFTVALHPLWCKFLAIDLGLKLDGIALAGCLSNFLNYALMTVLFWLSKDLREAFTLPDSRAFRGLGEYLALGIPSVVVLCLDFWAYELMTVASGLLGVKEQASQVIVMNMCEMSFMVAMGLQSAACTVQGNQIGKRDFTGACRYYRVIIFIASSLILAEIFFIHSFRLEFLALMTDNPLIIKTASSILLMFTLNVWFESFRGFVRGIIKALNLQDKTIVPSVFSQWIISPFLTWYLTFKVGGDGMGLLGIWVAKIAVEVFMCAAYFYIV